jgi:putative ABC transport system ATP-binding protein
VESANGGNGKRENEETAEPSDDTGLIVEAGNIYKSYHGQVTTEVLKGISFTARRGEFLTIFGPSGCGKTTVLNLLGGLDQPDSGELRVCGEELTRFDRRQLTRFRAEKLGFIFQFYNLIPTLTARENVVAGLEVLDLDYREIETRALAYLERVAMADRADYYPAQLSGGEQQRVAIARALAKEPELVLADEPTGNLDQKTAEGVTSLMKELIRETGLGCVVVSHNTGIREVSDRVIDIVDGRAE